MLKEGATLTKLIHPVLLLAPTAYQVEEIESILCQNDTVQFEVVNCTSCTDAFNLLDKEPIYTTILLNLPLANKTNIHVLGELVKKFPDKSIIIIADEVYRDKGISLIKEGAQDFILKSELTASRLSRAIQFASERNTIRKEAKSVAIKSQEHYQDVFNKSKDAIYICDLDGNLVNYNKSTASLLDISYDKLQSIDIHNLMYSQKRRNDFLVRLVAAKNVEDFEMEIERPQGERRQCLITARMMEHTDFTGYTGIIRDITEQKQAESLKKARNLAHQSAKMKEQFLASISHEMRTPMNAILGMSNLVIQTDLDEEQHNYISSIKQSSEILLGVVNDILQISEIQNGKVKFENKNFNLHELLNNLINVMQYKAKEKKLGLELVQDDGTPTIIRGDKLRLNQILYNLVGNAIKFTDSGHVKIYVVNLNQNSYSVQIKFIVEDTGIGIPPDKVDAIFESFTRIRTKDRIYEGTGLGLSIVKNLVEQQGGKIGASSEFGAGSNFFFDLIFEIGEELEFDSDAPAEILLDRDAPIKLLLVEDHKMNQLVAKKTLEKQWKNIKITIANNGKEAITILEKELFDIILMDIQMPIMNGYEATQHIRHKMPAEVAQTPILAMTAHAHISQDEKFKTYGMDDYVLKPFEPEQLFKKIGQYALINKTVR